MIGIIAGVVAAATTAITTIAATVGPALATVATSAKALILGSGTLGISDIIFIINIIKDIAKALGITDDQVDNEMLGAKACEAELQPENFDSTEKYIEYLRNEVQLDKEKYANRSEGETLAHKALGAGLLLKGIKEKSNIELSPVFLEVAAKNKLESGEVLGIVNACKEIGVSSTTMIDGYMKNSLSLEDKIKTGNIIMAGLKEANPNFNSEEVEDRLTDIELSYDR